MNDSTENERLKAQAQPAEPFWHAVVSEKSPVINKAIRRLDVAEEYAAACREQGYRGDIEVVPLYRATSTPPQPAAEVDAPLDERPDEHPAARRLRLAFEAKYGSYANAFRSIQHWRITLNEFRDAINRDREHPTAEVDVEVAERGVFDSLGAFAANALATRTKAPSAVPEPVPGAVWYEGSVSLIRRDTEDDYCRRRGAQRIYFGASTTAPSAAKAESPTDLDTLRGGEGCAARPLSH